MSATKREVIKPKTQVVARIASGNTAAEIAAVLSEVPECWTFTRHDYLKLHMHRDESGKVSDSAIAENGLVFEKPVES